MTDERWTARDASVWVVAPTETDDKYARGVVGFATGSVRYPGAAALGVDAALHTGIGMVRFVGPAPVADLVLRRRPEAVVGVGRAQAWVAGSGMEADDAEGHGRVSAVIALGTPLVLDAGAIARAPESAEPVIVTPHAGELANALGIARETVLAEPVASARAAAIALGAVVLLKGSTTYVVDAERVVAVEEATPWLATAGAGDALAGVLGALVASWGARHAVTPDDLVGLGATAAYLHGRAARIASGGGPFTILDLTAALPRSVAELLA